MTVTGVNDDPVAQNDVLSTDEDASLTFNPLENNGSGPDFDTDTNDTIMVSDIDGISALSAIVTLNGDGTVTYDPRVSDTLQNLSAMDSPVVDSFSYTISDVSGATATAQVSITVSGQNDNPHAATDTLATNEDMTVLFNPLIDNGNGPDFDTDITDTIMVSDIDAASVLGATMTLDENGTVTYDPTNSASLQNLSATDGPVNDSFFYTISDESGATSTAQVSITVSGRNDNPNAANDVLATNKDTRISFNPLSDNGNGPDSDPDSTDVLTVSSVDSESSLGATVTLNEDGTVTYDPTMAATLQGLNMTDAPLVDTFDYTSSDGNGGTDTATVTVTVTGPEGHFTIGGVFQIAQNNSMNTFQVLENDMPLPPGTGTFMVDSAQASVAGATAVPSADGQGIDYTPAPDFLGRDIVTYSILSSTDETDTAFATFEVTKGKSELDKHIHANLRVYVNGEKVANPPENIGVESTSPTTIFTSETHTHDPDGRLHIHSINDVPKTEPSTLGDFFMTWQTNAGLAGNDPNAIFNENQIYDNVVNTNSQIHMFVNGLPNFEYENYVPENEDDIVIIYGPTMNVETPFVLPIGDVTVEVGSPLHIPLDGFDLHHDDLTFTAVSDDPSIIKTTILEVNRNMRLTVEDIGVMNFRFFDGRTPRVTNQISQLVPFYAEVPFHRILNDFVIQGGDITNGNGTGGSKLGNFDDQYHVDLQHNRTGLLSMAKSSDDTNDSQFFVTEGQSRHLDGNHSIFGILLEGENVRQIISDVPTDGGGVPTGDPVIIQSGEVYTDNENGVLMLEVVDGITEGSTDITINVQDSKGNSMSWTFNTVVGPETANGAPFLTDGIVADVTTATNTSFEIPVSAVDFEDDPFVIGTNRSYLEQVIEFENENDELGVTSPGTTDFGYQGTNWNGGTVLATGNTALHSSGLFAYEFGADGGEITFDFPMVFTEFFFVHGLGQPEGTATAFDATDNEVDSVDSILATTFNDTNVFDLVRLQNGPSFDPISRITFTGGVVDSFNFFGEFGFDVDQNAGIITATPPIGMVGTTDIQVQVEQSDTVRSDTSDPFDSQIVLVTVVEATQPLLASTVGDRNLATPVESTISSDDPRLRVAFQSALSTWQGALAIPAAFDVDLEVRDLDDRRLATTTVLAISENGLPSFSRIVIDNDGAGQGWHTDVDQNPAADEYDLYTVLLHEIGHALGFQKAIASYPGSNDGHSITADDEHGVHLDGNEHRRDLMNHQLPLGERRLPSNLDLQILHSYYGDALSHGQLANEIESIDLVFREYVDHLH